MKKLFVLISMTFLLTSSIKSFSQIGVTSYSIYALGINTSQNNIISGELKTFANRSIDDLLMEIDVFYNFKPKTYHRFSIGLGLNMVPGREFDRMHALTIPAQLEVYPLQNFKKLSLLFELTPEIIENYDINIRSLWGIRYTFSDQ
jgi:hypothetical protein